MGIRWPFGWWSDTQTEIVECRNCGRSLETADGPCPSCGSDEIARYSLA